MNDFFTEEQYKRLLSNGSPENRDQDHAPVVMLTLPFTACVWLLSEIDPEDPDIAFGLCDLGMGFPELGSVSISELQTVKNPVFKLPVINDPRFKAAYPMSAYAAAARDQQEIVWDAEVVARYASKTKPGGLTP
ncbi:MAG TPA: DUF2958 domain-containing protein [Flavipsychrobacter sp.]|nr:DUF2958 domain-containing protein [Flavipsychrobacter sp.]